MGRKEYFENVNVKPTNKYWCKVCDGVADFVIINSNKTVYEEGYVTPLCLHCATFLQQRLFEGMEMSFKNEN